MRSKVFLFVLATMVCLFASFTSIAIEPSDFVGTSFNGGIVWEGEGDTWRAKTDTGYVENSWIEDISTGNWYYIGGEDGITMQTGLFTDTNTGLMYLLETEHNGNYGRMVTEDGTYTVNGQSLDLSFNQNHDGDFGSITNGNFIYSNGRFIDTTKPMIAFTFDDGPHSSYDIALMNILESVGGRGTFFVVGSRISSNQSTIMDMANRQHEIANHTWSHDTSLRNKAVSTIQSEFSSVDNTVSALTGIEPKVYRMPGGSANDRVFSSISKPLIYWSIDTLDWKYRNSSSVLSKLRGQVRDGDIVLMHSLYQSTVEACSVIVPELSAQGYQFVTVSELIAIRGGNLDLSKQHTAFRP